MNIEKIKELVKTFRQSNYKDLFAALVLNEKIDFLHELEDLNDGDIKYLEELLIKFMDDESITSLLNPDIFDLMEE